jgi:hypothetical protein
MNNETDEILAYLEYIRSQNRLVSVVSSYKGVSYSLIVNILSLSPKEKSITISTQHRQNMSLLKNTTIDVHSDLFPFPVYANVSDVNTQRKTAVLNNFEYKRGLSEHRSHVRVQPGKAIPIILNCENGVQYKAYIWDISLNGVAVIFKEEPGDAEGAFQSDKSVRLSFNIQVADAASPHSFTIPAKIIYAALIEGGRYRIGMEIFPTLNDQSLLRRFIFDRQTELYQEVTSR